MRPEGFPPGKTVESDSISSSSRSFNEAGRFPSRKNESLEDELWQALLFLVSMRPEGFPPGKPPPNVRIAEYHDVSMRPEGFPPGKGDAEVDILCRRVLVSMRPEGFPPGKEDLILEITAISVEFQ